MKKIVWILALIVNSLIGWFVGLWAASLVKKIAWIVTLSVSGLIGWFVGLWAVPLLPAVLLAYDAGALCSYRNKPKKVRYGQWLTLIIIAAVVGSLVNVPEARASDGTGFMWLGCLFFTGISFLTGWGIRLTYSVYKDPVL